MNMELAKNFDEFINESRRDPASIKKEYQELKKMSIQGLRDKWSRSHRVGDPKELDKEGLVMDILVSKHGDKYVEKAFENINENKVEFIADDMLGRMAGYKEHGEKYVGAFNPKSAKRIDDYVLLELTDFDRDLVKHIRLKPSEYIFRYETETTRIGGMRPFVKVNIDSGRVYFLTDDAMERDIIEFKGRGVKTTYFKIRPEKLK